MKIIAIWFKFYWSLFTEVQLWALVQVMDWRRTGTPYVNQWCPYLLMYICVTRIQWIKGRLPSNDITWLLVRLYWYDWSLTLLVHVLPPTRSRASNKRTSMPLSCRSLAEDEPGKNKYQCEFAYCRVKTLDMKQNHVWHNNKLHQHAKCHAVPSMCSAENARNPQIWPVSLSQICTQIRNNQQTVTKI